MCAKGYTPSRAGDITRAIQGCGTNCGGIAPWAREQVTLELLLWERWDLEPYQGRQVLHAIGLCSSLVLLLVFLLLSLSPFYHHLFLKQ